MYNWLSSSLATLGSCHSSSSTSSHVIINQLSLISYLLVNSTYASAWTAIQTFLSNWSSI